MSHPIITLYLVWCISHSNSWSTSPALTKVFLGYGCQNSKSHFLNFEKQIYRSLARVLRKLSRMTLTLELQILQLAISLRSKIHSTRSSLALTSPYNIYYKAVAAYKFFQVGYTLLSLLLVFCGILRLSQFTKVL
jgi:hypothetical protein